MSHQPISLCADTYSTIQHEDALQHRVLTTEMANEALSEMLSAARPIHSCFDGISNGEPEFSDMYDLTGFQRDLLYVVVGLGKPHGLAIKNELDDYYEKDIQHGRLYPNLDTLVEKGLIEKGSKDRRTNQYSITRRGTRELDARTEWEAGYIEHTD